MKKNLIFAAVLCVALVWGLVSCEPSKPATSNKVKTGKATNITQNSALLYGEVDIDITAYDDIEFGVLIATDKEELNARKGKDYEAEVLLGKEFEVQLNKLSADTKYYYCAWLFLNKKQYEFGEIKSFKTLSSEDLNIGKRTFEKHNGHAYVDLGLPSGLKWATCNVGASTPEGYGNYYAWGETTPKSTCDWSTYKWCNGSSTTMIKYCIDSDEGTVDNKTILDKEDDAAAVNMGGNWRMPSKAEQDELQTECTWTWTTLNGVNGYNVKGPNGNSIFLPAAGYRGNSDLNSAGSNGGYWLSSLDTDDSNYAYGLGFDSGGVGWGGSYRYYGQSVRGVFSR